MHIFDLYRRGVTIVIAVYGVVRIAQSLYRWAPQLSGTSRQSRLLRSYLTAMVLSVRIRRFWVELLEIVILLAILGWVVYSHTFLLEHM